MNDNADWIRRIRDECRAEMRRWPPGVLAYITRSEQRQQSDPARGAPAKRGDDA